MSEKYGSHKEWTFGMECELPYKVCFALDKSPDSMTFLEVKRGGDTVIRLFSDMGGKTRTIEMITEPLKIGQVIAVSYTHLDVYKRQVQGQHI